MLRDIVILIPTCREKNLKATIFDNSKIFRPAAAGLNMTKAYSRVTSVNYYD